MNRIRETREQAGISQADLYRSLGWKQSRLANYETGNRTPGLAEAREIVAALNRLSATCTLELVFPENPEDTSALPRCEAPNLSQTIHGNNNRRQSNDNAGILSSISQVSA